MDDSPASTAAAHRREFERLGLVDATIPQLCSTNRDELTLLTHDQALVRAARHLGVTVENFTDRQ